MDAVHHADHGQPAAVRRRPGEEVLLVRGEQRRPVAGGQVVPADREEVGCRVGGGEQSGRVGQPARVVPTARHRGVGDRTDLTGRGVDQQQLVGGGDQGHPGQQHPAAVRGRGGVVEIAAAVEQHPFGALAHPALDDVELDPVAPVGRVDHGVRPNIEQVVQVRRVVRQRAQRDGSGQVLGRAVVGLLRRLRQLQQRELGPLGAAGVGGDHHRPGAGQVPAGARFAEIGQLAPPAVREQLVQLGRSGLVVADQHPAGRIDVQQRGAAKLEQMDQPVGSGTHLCILPSSPTSRPRRYEAAGAKPPAVQPTSGGQRRPAVSRRRSVQRRPAVARQPAGSSNQRSCSKSAETSPASTSSLGSAGWASARILAPSLR